MTYTKLQDGMIRAADRLSENPPHDCETDGHVIIRRSAQYCGRHYIETKCIKCREDLTQPSTTPA